MEIDWQDIFDDVRDDLFKINTEFLMDFKDHLMSADDLCDLDCILEKVQNGYADAYLKFANISRNLSFTEKKLDAEFSGSALDYLIGALNFEEMPTHCESEDCKDAKILVKIVDKTNYEPYAYGGAALGVIALGAYLYSKKKNEKKIDSQAAKENFLNM